MRVTVIGGGIIGCAAAYELVRRGATVTLIDMRHPGDGATHASAGMLVPHIESHSPAFLQLGVSSLSMYDAFVDRVRADAGRDVEYRRGGSLQVALTDIQQQHLRGVAGSYRASGVAHRLLDAKELRESEPALAAGVAGGLFVPDHGFVSARHLTAALASAAERRGARIVSDRRVDHVAVEGGETRVYAGTEVFGADAVVIAAGSWSGQIVIERARPAVVTPIRGQLLQLACASPAASHVLWGSDCYLVPWRDGTLLVGATSEDVGFDERATVAAVRGLLDAACALLPPAGQARFHEVRVGLRPSTGDGLPIIGRAAALPNVVYATGHYRNGVLLAPLTAEAVADLVLEGSARPDLALTAPARFGL